MGVGVFNSDSKPQGAHGPLLVVGGRSHAELASFLINSEIDNAYSEFVSYLMELTQTQWPTEPNDDAITLVSLFASMLELGEALSMLLRANHWTACGGVLRGQIELFATLMELENHPTPHRRECETNLQKLEQMAKTISDATNSGLPSYDLGVEQQINEITNRYPDIEAKVRKYSNLLKDADPRLKQIYEHLCLETHNKLNVVRARHVRGNSVHVFEPIPENFAKQFVQWSAYCMINPMEWYLARAQMNDEKTRLDELFGRLKVLTGSA